MRIALISLFIITSIFSVNAQCFDFARKVGKKQLGEFMHDGNYNATVLTEGEKAELYKTFFSGQKYRIAISKVAQMPDIHFRLLDEEGNVLFDNLAHDYRLIWDFEVETTQMLVVEMNVLEKSSPDSENLIAGCVSVMFGIESDKKKKNKS